jgi:hypothetical protein
MEQRRFVVSVLPTRSRSGPLRAELSTSDDIQPFVFAFVVVWPRAAAGRSHIEKGRELPAGLFAVEQHNYGLAKRR